jgi:hypothetical protein
LYCTGSLQKDVSEVLMNPFIKKNIQQWRKNLWSIRDLVAKLFIAILAIYAVGGEQWSTQKEVL